MFDFVVLKMYFCIKQFILVSMQKYRFLIILLMTIVAVNFKVQASLPIIMEVSKINPIGEQTHPKSPIMPPSVTLDGHTLYFDTPCDGCTLNIVDENDVVVYALVIPTGTTSLVLPSTLSGDYTIQIIRGNYLFYGTINLP